MISIQVLYVLLMIIGVYITLLFLVLDRLKKRDGQNLGPKLKEDLNNVSFKSINRNEYFVRNLLNTDENVLFIFAESNCSECKRILRAMRHLHESVNIDIKVVFSDTEENLKGATEYYWLPNKYFLDLEFMIEDLRVNVFPFFIEIGSHGLVETKGFVSIDLLLQRIDENKKTIKMNLEGVGE